VSHVLLQIHFSLSKPYFLTQFGRLAGRFAYGTLPLDSLPTVWSFCLLDILSAGQFAYYLEILPTRFYNFGKIHSL